MFACDSTFTAVLPCCRSRYQKQHLLPSTIYCQAAALQDKVGPFARSAQDVAVVLDVLRGSDLNEMDPSAFDAELDDPFRVDPANLTVGFLGDVPSSVRLVPATTSRSLLQCAACLSRGTPA